MGDLLHAVQVIYNRTYDVVPMLIVAVIWYLVAVTVLTFFQRKVEDYYSRGATRTAPKATAQQGPDAGPGSTTAAVRNEENQ